MQLSVARKVGPRWAGELTATLLLGFGAGMAVGFLLREGRATDGRGRHARKLRRPGPRQTARLLARVRTALAAGPALAGEAIEVQRRGGGLELRGWVTTRAARSLAWRLARAAAGPADLINHLLVRGEDDRATPPEETSLSA